MSFDLDKSVDCVGAPIITLAGREFFVPPLALRQSRVAVPLLIRLMPALSAVDERADALGEGEWDSLIRLVHAAITRAYPGAKLDDVLDLPATLAELASAVGVITRQTGMFKTAADDAGEAKGEAENDGPAPPSISTN